MRLLIASPMTLWQLLTAVLGVSVYATGTADSQKRDLSSNSDQNATAIISERQPDFTFDQLYKLQMRFLDTFITASNTSQALLVDSTILAENVQGRVDITRTFEGRELNTEYLFGLFAKLAASTSVSLLGFPTSYEILQFTANANIAAVSVRFSFRYPAFDFSLPIVIFIWSAFNAAGEVEQYDATFRRFEWMIDTLLTVAAANLGANSTADAQQKITYPLAESICAIEAQYCNGTLSQYNSSMACMDFLTTQVRFGKPYELGRNTLLCRMVHQNMVAYRPEVHCSHIGPTGGGYCIDDLTYDSVVNDKYFTNSPFIPYGYGNQNTSSEAT